MVIARKKSVTDAAGEAFVSGAPDASRLAPVVKAVKTAGHKSIITVSISPDVLARLDAWAKGRGMSRAAAISFAVSLLE